MSTEIVTSMDGHVATVEINRPQTSNAIDFPMRADLLTAFEDLARSPDVGAVVLTGAGNAFSSGSDLKSAASHPDTSVRRTARTLLHHFQPLIECITRMDKPVIAAVNGAAVGIGMSLALACDLLVMSDKAYLLSPFCGLGLIPDGGAAWFLTRRIGYARAFELLAEGHKVSASRCLELGLANRVVEASALRDTALRWATELAQRPPIALALTKRITRMSLAMGLSEILSMEAEMQTFCAGTEDAREALAAFSEKRSPNFKGR
jgi:2-(1,2-epoxy-1,2-dihydrophenyl)acetyl-CoA isomerase